MKKVILFTDGSCYYKTRRGGIGVYIKYDNKEKFISQGFENTTISRMEMTALLISIQQINPKIKVNLIIYSDSEFIVNSFNKKWFYDWKESNFIGRKNNDIWRKISFEFDSRPFLKFKIFHIKGHQKDLLNPIIYGNNVADLLANYKNFL